MKCARKQGFTLIEIIGVLFIIAILATAIVPSLSSQVTRAYADAETQSQESIGDALRGFAIASQRIPITIATWPDSLAGYLEVPASDVGVTKGVGGTRRLIADPSHGLSLTAGVYDQAAAFIAATTTTGNLPVAKPSNARFIVVSSLSGAAPAADPSAAEFAGIWDQTAAAPAAFAETEQLRIHRVSLTSAFHPVTIMVVGSAITEANPVSQDIFFAFGKLIEYKEPVVYLENGLVDPFGDEMMVLRSNPPGGDECSNNSGASLTFCQGKYGAGATGCNVPQKACQCGAADCWTLAASSSSAATSSAVAASSVGGGGGGGSSASAAYSTPSWSISGVAAGSEKDLPATSFTVWLLEGSMVKLWNNGAVVGAYVVSGPRSFVYDGYNWSH